MRIVVCGECGTRLADDATYCVACWVQGSTAAQGLPAKVTDPVVIGTVVVLLGGTP